MDVPAIMALATPWQSRKKIKTLKEGVRLQPKELKQNRPMPIRKSFRLPIISAKRPQGMDKAALVNR
ncbi:hypothetical protein HMPREF0322_02613 [Desulfitobacterium hafniense DP7]|uniref:Uncharacterized protein n=1 Tax=Desulfitobacterium hafniense DP7 TaxID=537010 RepID=G9XNR7_DESHA|nr:hypothetical protein HMPREF0322_02613 [Desulfitobacterium hafniense DP7]